MLSGVDDGGVCVCVCVCVCVWGGGCVCEGGGAPGSLVPDTTRWQPLWQHLSGLTCNYTAATSEFRLKTNQSTPESVDQVKRSRANVGSIRCLEVVEVGGGDRREMIHYSEVKNHGDNNPVCSERHKQPGCGERAERGPARGSPLDNLHPVVTHMSNNTQPLCVAVKTQTTTLAWRYASFCVRFQHQPAPPSLLPAQLALLPDSSSGSSPLSVSSPQITK